MQTILCFFIFPLCCINTQHFVLANTNIPKSQQRSDDPYFIRPGNQTDYEALLAFKAHISTNPAYSVLTWWNNSLHYCDWEGITCGQRHRRVVSLYLPSSNLAGTLSPFIGNLSFLRHLNLMNNSFRGNIPHQVFQLPRLRKLFLHSNYFEGEIPANLSHYLHLNKLGLGSNNLVGRIPDKLASLPNLVYLDLIENNFSGRLHAIGVGNMSASLQYVLLSDNKLEGSIPDDIGRTSNSLLVLGIADNILSGTIPTSLFNLSSLVSLDLSGSQLQGHLPQDLGILLPQLNFFAILHNYLTGHVPPSLSNLSRIESIQLGYNSFIGTFYLNGNNLPHLSFLNIMNAFSSGSGEARDLSFVDTLTNCTNLTSLFIAGNSFVGTLPDSILNLSTSLTDLALGSNQISGHIPFGLGKYTNLQGLELADNHFEGSIPLDISKLESIQLLSLDKNNLSGEIPSSLQNLTRLSELYMHENNLQGSLPKSLGNCKSLQNIEVAYNKLSGVLPVELFDVSSLVGLDIGENNFQGSLPIEISRLKFLVVLAVENNRFSGEIPSTLGGCTSLTFLDMSRNSFVGSIPESLSPLKSIAYLDLSCNHLSGQIPSYISTWPYLLNLNLSFNTLEGEVPVNGVFANTSAVSVVGNSKLCGGVLNLHLPRCPMSRRSKKRRLSLALIVIISTVCVLIITLLVALCFYLLCLSRKRKDVSSQLQNFKHFPEVSYQMLSRATNGFSSSSLIGVGAFGSVYRGTLVQDGTEVVVAVKVIDLRNRGASKSFMAECNALRNIRHRNLVKIITVCSTIDTQQNDFKALVYEFMPRGSLESWLHSSNLVTSETVGGNQSCSLSFLQRLSIVIDVACALEYLHIGYGNPIIHCDLKPTNILIDDEMTAHVGDFGLAKFLSGASTSSTMSQSSSSTQVRGTVGYAAPEYGMGSKASVEGDIYSFGIVVLEMMTSKKPIDPMFTEGLNLHDFAKSAFPDRIMEIIDQRILLGDEANLLRGINGADIRKIECIKSLFMVGVQCSVELPRDRMSINDAINELKSVRQNLLCIRTN